MADQSLGQALMDAMDQVKDLRTQVAELKKDNASLRGGIYADPCERCGNSKDNLGRCIACIEAQLRTAREALNAVR